MSAVLAVAIGLLTGILSGFGIGGGSLLLLYLTLFEGAGQYQAGGINLLYFLSCAPAALISHRKNGLIEREAVKCCVPAGVVTSVLSALLAARVDTDLLRRAFGVVLLYIGVKETFCAKNNTFFTFREEGVKHRETTVSPTSRNGPWAVPKSFKSSYTETFPPEV